MYVVRKASGLQVAAWPMAKIPTLELQREEAGVGPHGNKDTEMVQGGKSTPAPSHLQGSRGPLHTLWKTMGPASLSLHRLWLEYSNESSWEKPPANWFLIKNNIFLTQAPPSRGILVNKKDTPRESRNQQASPTTRQALSCGETARSPMDWQGPVAEDAVQVEFPETWGKSES